MSQILVKQDPLVDFIPLWTEITENSFDDNGLDAVKLDRLARQRGLKYIDHAKCYVGEARDFNGDYLLRDNRCDVCLKFSHSVMSNLHDGGLKWFYKYKQELYDHIESCHKK